MAKGLMCKDCKSCWMYAYKEIEETYGSWVYYVCRKCGYEDKVFEGK